MQEATDKTVDRWELIGHEVLRQYPLHVVKMSVIDYACANLNEPPRWFRVEAEEGRFFLKRHRAGKPGTEALPDILQHLAQSGFTHTPKMLASGSGTYLMVHAGDVWSVSEWRELQSFLAPEDQPSGDAFVRAADLLGRMHAASRGFRTWKHWPSHADFVARCRGVMETFDAFERRHLPGTEDPVYCAAVDPLLPIFRDESSRLIEEAERNGNAYTAVYERAASEGGFVHSDIGPLNLMRAGPEMVVLDWESWSQALRWQNDLTFLTVHCPGPFPLRVLEAYHRNCRIGPEEGRVVPLLFNPVFELASLLRDSWAVPHKLRLGLPRIGEPQVRIPQDRQQWDEMAEHIASLPR